MSKELLKELRSMLSNQVVTFEKGLMSKESTSAIGFLTNLTNMQVKRNGVVPRKGTALMNDTSINGKVWFYVKSVTIAGVDVILAVSKANRRLYGYLKWWPEIDFPIIDESLTEDYVGDTAHVGFVSGSRFTISEDPEYVNVMNNAGQTYRISKKYFRIDLVNQEYETESRTASRQKIHENTMESARERGSEVGIFVSVKNASFSELPDYYVIDVRESDYKSPNFIPFKGDVSVSPVNEFGSLGEIRHEKYFENYRRGIISLARGFTITDGFMYGEIVTLTQDISVGEDQLLMYYDTAGNIDYITSDFEIDYNEEDVVVSRGVIQNSTYLFTEEPLDTTGNDSMYAINSTGLGVRQCFISIGDYVGTSDSGEPLSYKYQITKMQAPVGGYSPFSVRDPGSPFWSTSEVDCELFLRPATGDTKQIVTRAGILFSGIPGDSSCTIYKHKHFDTWEKTYTDITKTIIADTLQLSDIDFLKGRMFLSGSDRGLQLALDGGQLSNIDVTGRFAVRFGDVVKGISQRTTLLTDTGFKKEYLPFCCLTEQSLRSFVDNKINYEIPVDSHVVAGSNLYCVSGFSLWRGDVDGFTLSERVQTFDSMVRDIVPFGNVSVVATEQKVFSVSDKVEVVKGVPGCTKLVSGISMVLAITHKGDVYAVIPKREGNGRIYFSGQPFSIPVSDIHIPDDTPVTYIPPHDSEDGMFYVASGASVYGVTESGRWSYHAEFDNDVEFLTSIDKELVIILKDDDDDDYEYEQIGGSS